MTIGIVVVDDHAIVRTGFEALFSSQPDIEVLGTAEDGNQAIDVVQRTNPDVVMMDVRMPELDGLAASRVILEPENPPKVVMLTTFDVDDYVYEALSVGASGFLLKDSRPEDLLNAVRVVAAGEALLSPKITRRLIGEFARHRPKPPTATRINALTSREQEVLTLIARGLSNTEIAAELVVVEQTVKTHISRIFTKLDLRDRAQAVVFAYESGVVTPGLE